MLVFKTSPARIGKLGAPVDTWGGAPRTLSNPNVAVQSREVLPPEHIISSSTVVKAYVVLILFFDNMTEFSSILILLI